MPRQIIVPRPIARTALTSPLEIPGTAAWYDLSKLSSLIYDGSNRLQLVADVSGNSAVNCLVMPGASANTVTVPDSAALSITGDIDIRVNVAFDSWTPGSDQEIIGKLNSDGQSSWQFFLKSTGALVFRYTATGAFAGLKTAISSATLGLSVFAQKWVRATYATATGATDFYSSSDGSSWTALGTTQTITAGSIFDGTDPVAIGRVVGAAPASKTFRAQIYNGIAGTLVFDANFANVAKLATSFTESSSNAATVTINTSGDNGARICGARDLVQMTQSKQPILTLTPAGNYATFDGSNDYLKSAPFSFSQPESVYFVGSQVTWTINEDIYDGNTTDSGALFQNATTPSLAQYSGSTANSNSELPVATRGLVTCVFNNSATTSSVRVNKGSAVTGQRGGSANMNGFTVAANGGASGAFGNITFCGALLRSSLDSLATQNRLASYFMPRLGIPG